MGGGSVPGAAGGGWLGGLGDLLGGGTPGRGSGARGDSVLEAAAKSAVRAIGTQLGREIVRGVLGSILGGSGRRR